MSNEYFVFDSGRMVPGEPALAEDINAVFDGVVTGFDALPSRSSLIFNNTSYVIATGTLGNYELAIDISSYPDGGLVVFKANHMNPGPVTLNINSLGTRSLLSVNGDELESGDILQNHIYSARFNSTYDRFELQLLNAAGGGVAPGSLIFSASETPPPSTLATNGASYLRSPYPALFAAIGVMYGPGADPGNTFQVPDYRGYHFRATANGSTVDPDRATRTNRGDGTVGDAVGTKQGDAVRNHVHYLQQADRTGSVTLGSYSLSYLGYSSSGGTSGNPTSGGAAESRPKNVNINVYIRY